jgi:hypothetical protein
MLKSYNKLDHIENIDEEGSQIIYSQYVQIIDGIYKGLIPPEDFELWIAAENDTDGIYFGMSILLHGRVRHFALIHTASEASIDILLQLYPHAFRACQGCSCHDN